MALEYRSPTEEEFDAVSRATYLPFGEEPKDDDLERERALMPADRLLVAWDDGRPIGVTASYPFELTIPGGAAAAAGVSWVGVHPTHRRKGILRELMLRQLDDVHERGEPLAILYASESAIYGRFGYGISAPATQFDAERSAFALRDDPGPRGVVRLVDTDEAAQLFPPLHERVRLERPGFVGRSALWWTNWRLADPEHWRKGKSRKYFAYLELDGEPAGFAIYRVEPKWDAGTPKGELWVMEAFATSPEASAELWRYLFGVDLVERVKSRAADPAWPLLLMVADPRRLHMTVDEGLWLRLVDVEPALAARSYGPGEGVVLEVADAVLTRNAGRFGIEESGVARTDADPDVAIDVADLACVYLGAFTFAQLAVAGRARELRAGGIARATALFATPLPPWCPEGF